MCPFRRDLTPCIYSTHPAFCKSLRLKQQVRHLFGSRVFPEAVEHHAIHAQRCLVLALSNGLEDLLCLTLILTFSFLDFGSTLIVTFNTIDFSSSSFLQHTTLRRCILRHGALPM